MRRAVLVAIAVGLGAAAPRAAFARRGVRPLFEPTDLELEPPGVAELDLQLGLIRGQGPWRLVVPDFELDVGVLPDVEIDIDGAYALEAPQGSSSLNVRNPMPDNLWVGLKMGLVDWYNDNGGPDGGDGTRPLRLEAWALGLQVGPKIPVAPDSHGLGVEAILLISHLVNGAFIVANVGGFVDPKLEGNTGRPEGVELGVSFDRDLDARGRFQVNASLGAVKFTTPEPDQLVVTAGLGWTLAGGDTQLTLLGLAGILDGSDRYGALVGVAQKLRFFKWPRGPSHQARSALAFPG